MRVLRVGAGVLGCLVYTGTSAAAPQPTSAEPGAQLYADYCSVCHGDRGDGNSRARQGLQPPPANFAAPDAAARFTRQRMIAAVREGRPGTAMVGWASRLDDAQIEAVVDYIRAQFMAPPDNPEGQQIYATTCSVCHGEEGRGALWGQTSLQPPPVDFTAPAVKRQLTRERMIASVTHGRPGTAMAAFGSQLDGGQIEAVVDYIRAAFLPADKPSMATAEVSSPTPPVAQQLLQNKELPDTLQGNSQSGQALYLQNCVACHGAQGDGNGPRAYFIFPKPRNFTHEQTRASFDRPTLFHAIKLGVVGREMPAWGKVLTDQQIADITEYVLAAFFRPDPTSPAQASGH